MQTVADAPTEIGIHGKGEPGDGVIPRTAVQKETGSDATTQEDMGIEMISERCTCFDNVGKEIPSLDDHP